MLQFLLNAAPFVLIALAFALFWCMTITLIGRATGWWALARRYRTMEPFEGKRWRFEHIQMRWSTKYSGAITVGANPAGLYLAVMPPFNIGHPNLFIPWAETKIVMKHHFLAGDYMEMTFPEVPNTLLRCGAGLAERIAASFNTKMPTDSLRGSGATN
jgi:hypothetical protein